MKTFLLQTDGSKYKIVNTTNNEIIKDNLSYEEAVTLEEILNN